MECRYVLELLELIFSYVIVIRMLLGLFVTVILNLKVRGHLQYHWHQAKDGVHQVGW